MFFPTIATSNKAAPGSFSPFPTIPPLVRNVAKAALACFAVSLLVTPPGALLAVAAAPILYKRACNTNATSSPAVAVELGSAQLSYANSVLQFSIAQMSSGNFLEAIAEVADVRLVPLNATLYAGSSTTFNYLLPGTGASNQEVELLSLGTINSTLVSVYGKGGTSNNVVDYNLFDSSSYTVFNSVSTTLSIAGSLDSSSVVTTSGVMTAIVPSSSTSHVPILLLYPKTGGAPTQVSLGSTAVSNAGVSTTLLNNGNVAIFWTYSGFVYGSVVTPTGSVVVSPLGIGSCFTLYTPVAVSSATLSNGNIVIGNINASEQAAFTIVDPTLTSIITSQTPVDGCTGYQVSVVKIRDGFGYLISGPQNYLSFYYFGPTGSLIGQFPPSFSSIHVNPGVSGVRVPAISYLTGPRGSSQVVVSMPYNLNATVFLAQIDAAPQVSTSISSPQVFQVGQQVALAAGFTDPDAPWGDTFTTSYTTTTNGPALSYNGSHLIGTIQPGNRGNFSSSLIATDTAGLTTPINFNGTVQDQPLTVSPIPSPVNVTLGYPFSWTVPNGTFVSPFSDTLTYSLLGTLPAGLTFDAQTQQVSGTAGSSNGLSFFQEVLKVVNPYGTTAQTNVTFQTVSLPPAPATTLSTSLQATVGAYVLNVANLVTDVFSLVFHLSNGPSTLSIDSSSGLITGVTTSNDVGIYTLNITICDLFKCLVWQPQFNLTSIGGGTTTSTLPVPTGPIVINPPYGSQMTTGQPFYLSLTHLCSGPVKIEGTTDADWLTFGQNETDYYVSTPRVPYSADPVTVNLNITSAGETAPVTPFQFVLQVRGYTAIQIGFAIASPIIGVISCVAGVLGVKKYFKNKAREGLQSLKSKISSGKSTSAASQVPLSEVQPRN